MHYTSELLLWLFNINLGISFGAGLYEKRIVLPLWFTISPDKGHRVNINAMREIDTGRKFWGAVNTVPLTLLTLASLVMSLQINGAGYHWWLIASLIILIERIGTFTFFIPKAIKLMHSEKLSGTKVSGLISSWLLLNNFRIAFTLAGWIIAQRALSLLV